MVDICSSYTSEEDENENEEEEKTLSLFEDPVAHFMIQRLILDEVEKEEKEDSNETAENTFSSIHASTLRSISSLAFLNQETNGTTALSENKKTVFGRAIYSCMTELIKVRTF